MDDGRYGIYEEVPDTGVLILREIPDPAPLQLGETRPEFDEEGEPIWYIGNQGIVGPTDEELVFAELPIPKIKLRRIQARHMTEVFSIRGVNGFGIGAKGFVVRLDLQHLKNESRIPIDLEGVPVEVEVASAPAFRSHDDLYLSPVPVAAGIQVNFGDGFIAGGTLGPHIVRDETQPGIACCQIWSLTASHVAQDLNAPSPTPGTRPVYQPSTIAGSNLWGYIAHSWSALACSTVADPHCTSPSAPINWTDRNPDVAAIAHVNLAHILLGNGVGAMAAGKDPV